MWRPVRRLSSCGAGPPHGQPPSSLASVAKSLMGRRFAIPLIAAALAGLWGAGLAFLVLPFIERWVRLEGFGPLALVMFAGLPVHLLSQVPQACLERALDFRSVALVELSIQIIF